MRKPTLYLLKIGEWLHTTEGIFEVVNFDELSNEVILKEVDHIAEDYNDSDTYLNETSWTIREVRRLVHSDTGIWFDAIKVVR